MVMVCFGPVPVASMAVSVEISFNRVGHFLRISVGLADGVTGRFLVDTGIGITVVHPSLADRLGLSSAGRDYLAHRMSGQEVRVPLLRAPRMDIAGEVVAGSVVGVGDFGNPDGENGFDGILGLDLLGEGPLTVDPFASVIRLGAPSPDPETSTVVPVRVNRDGPAVDMHTELRLPDGRVIEVEVDTGSGATILDTRFMAACRVDGHEEDARTEEGTDETAHRFVRRFVSIPGALALPSAPATAHEQPTIMFQDIELEGLIGTDFLDRFVQTYDTRNSTITLELPKP